VLAHYSNVGHSKVDVTAPGGASVQAPNPYGRVLNAWSTTADPADTAALIALNRVFEDCQGPGGTPPCFLYAWVQGTSMSAPHASGVAALIRAGDPDLPPMAVIAKMQNTAMPMACPDLTEAQQEAFFPFGMLRCTGTQNPDAQGSETNWYGNGLVDALAASLDRS
jgi:hypothetical protein